MFGRKHTTATDKSVMLIISIVLRALKGLHKLNNIIKPVNVNAIDAIVHIVTFDTLKYA